jgi:LysM repeat protein
LFGIALKFNISPGEIKAINQICSDINLFPGMSINIPLNCEDSSENSNVLLGNQGEQQDQGLQQNEDFKTSNDVIKEVF